MICCERAVLLHWTCTLGYQTMNGLSCLMTVSSYFIQTCSRDAIRCFVVAMWCWGDMTRYLKAFGSMLICSYLVYILSRSCLYYCSCRKYVCLLVYFTFSHQEPRSHYDSNHAAQMLVWVLAVQTLCWTVLLNVKSSDVQCFFVCLS